MNVSFKNSLRAKNERLAGGVGQRNNRSHNRLLDSLPIHLLRSGKDAMDIAYVVAP
jgi:hypothetical protein